MLVWRGKKKEAKFRSRLLSWLRTPSHLFMRAQFSEERRRGEGREGSTMLKSLKSLSKEMSNLGLTLPEDNVSCLQPPLNDDQTFPLQRKPYRRTDVF